MEWFLGFLIVVSLAVNAVLYILLRGGFLRFSHATKTLGETSKNLDEKVKNLELKLNLKDENPESFEEFSQRIDVIETRIGGLYETFDELDKEFTKLFQERMIPQLVPPAREVTGSKSEVKGNRGGRPPKVRAG